MNQRATGPWKAGIGFPEQPRYLNSMMSMSDNVLPLCRLILLRVAWKSHLGLTEQPELFAVVKLELGVNVFDSTNEISGADVASATGSIKSRIGSPGTYPNMVINMSAGSFT